MRNEIMNHNNSIENWINGFGDMFGSLPKANMKADVSETDQAYNVKIDMPDMDKKNMKLTYENNILYVTGKRDSFSDHEDNKGDLLMSERSYGEFSRSFRLPNVDKEKISANYTDGTLNITLPKSDKAGRVDNFIEIN